MLSRWKYVFSCNSMACASFPFPAETVLCGDDCASPDGRVLGLGLVMAGGTHPAPASDTPEEPPVGAGSKGKKERTHLLCQPLLHPTK